MNIFANRLKTIRKQKKISQTALSDMVGISQNQISKYEKGIDTPSGSVLLKLSEALKVSSEYLLGLINHVDLEERYKYMADFRKKLFSQPEGVLNYPYTISSEFKESVFKYVFAVFSIEETYIGGKRHEGDARFLLNAEFQPMLYIEEIKGNFLQLMLASDDDFMFGAFDGFLNDELSLGSCYFSTYPTEDNPDKNPKLKLMTKQVMPLKEGAMPMGSSKYSMISATRGYKPREYMVDIFEEAFLDFYLPLTIEAKVAFLYHV